MDLSRARLICLRHAESEDMIGQQPTDGVPASLTPRGLQQATHVAELLKDQSVAAVYSSDAVPARETAAVLADALDLEVAILPGLAEYNVSQAGEVTSEQVQQVLREWIVEGNLGARVSGGESGVQVAARVTGALTAIAAYHAHRPGIVVGHITSLTTGIGVLCGDGATGWSRPLGAGIPFALVRATGRWVCDWPR